MQKIFYLFVFVALMSGCATMKGNKKFESRYNQIQKGVTTRADVISLLGKPLRIDHPDEGHTILIYEKYKIYGEHWYSIFKKIDTDRLSVFIGSDDIVSEYKVDYMTGDYEPAVTAGSTFHAPSTAPINSSYRPYPYTPAGKY